MTTDKAIVERPPPATPALPPVLPRSTTFDASGPAALSTKTRTDVPWRRTLLVSLGRSRGALVETAGATFVADLLNLLPPLVFMAVLDHVLPAQAVPSLLALASLLVIAGMLRAAILYRTSRMLTHVTLRAEAALHERVRARLLTERAATNLQFLPDSAGEAFGEVQVIRGELEALLAGSMAILTAVLLLGVLSIVSAWLALIVAVVTAASIVMTWATEGAIRQARRANVSANEAYQKALIPSLLGRHRIAADPGRLIGLANRSFATFARLRRVIRRRQDLSSAVTRSGEAAALAVGAYWVIAGELTVGAFIACYIIANRAQAPLRQVAAGWRARRGLTAALARLAQVALPPSTRSDPGLASRSSGGLSAPERWPLRALLAATLLGLIGGSLLRLDVVASAPGRIVPHGEIKSIRSIENGLAARVNVANGTEVRAGDVLLSLDRSEIDARLEALAARERRIAAELASADAESALLAELTPLMERQLRDQDYLLARESTTRDRHDAAVQELLEHRRLRNAVQGRIDGLTARQHEIAAERAGLAARRDRLNLIAPVNGIVTELAVHAEGAAIVKGEKVMQVVPSDDEPVIEAYLPNRHRAFVRFGQSAIVKLDALPFERYGTLDAVVTHVAADSALDAEGGIHYPMRLEVRDDRATSAGTSVELLPGMTLMVQVITDERTIADYLLAPLTRGVREVFRES